MVLQYTAASFHLLSVSTANINTVQYPKSCHQYEIPTIPVIVISKVLLPQSNIMASLFTATAVYCLMSIQACQHKEIIISQNLKFYSVRPLAADPLRLLTKKSNCKHSTAHLNLSMPAMKVVIKLCNSITSYEC